MRIAPPTRRAMLGGLGGALGAAALAGCARARPPGELSVWAMGNEAASLPGLLPDFARAHPGIGVRLQPLPWSAAHEKLLTGFAGGSLPDVTQIGNTWLAELVAIGALAPLPDAERGLLEDQFPAVLDANTIGGRAWGVPWYVDTRLQFYRRDLLSRAGFDAPPARWDAWKAMLQRVRRVAGAGNYAILLPVNEFEPLLTLALSQPEPLLRDDGTRGNFSSGGFRETLAFYKSLFDERLAPVIANTQISNVWTEFARGFFSVYLSGPWTVGDMKARLPAAMQRDWATAPMPGPDGPGAAAPGGSSLVVTAGARDPVASWALVRWLSRPAVQARFNRLTGDLPARTSAWELTDIAADPRLAAFGTQLQHARAVPKVPEWERIVTEMQVVAERCVRGELGVVAACAEIDRRADRLLEKRRWMLDKGRAEA